MTPRQRDLLAFIASYQAANGGVSPSLNEMATALGLLAKSNMIRILDALEERGFIRRIKHAARSIEILRQPPRSAAPAVRRPVSAAAERVIPVYHLHAKPTAAKDHYPFLSHATCAEWGRPVHGEAA